MIFTDESPIRGSSILDFEYFEVESRRFYSELANKFLYFYGLGRPFQTILFSIWNMKTDPNLFQFKDIEIAIILHVWNRIDS